VTPRSLRSSALLLTFLVELSCGGEGSSSMTGPSSAVAPAPAPASAPASKPKHRFLLMPQSLDLPASKYAKLGAQHAAAGLGNVEILWRGPESADPARQKELLEAGIAEKVDGIAISCANGDSLAETIDKAVAAGIPVVTWESDAPKSKRQAFYGLDQLVAGKTLGEEAAKLLGHKGKVGLFTSPGSDGKRRLEGVQEALKGHSALEVVEVIEMKDDPAGSAEIVATASKKHPDLGAWISVGSGLVSTPSALEAVDTTRTRVVGFGTLPSALEAMKAGKVQALVGPKYFAWGSEPVKMLAEIKAGKPPAEAIIDSGVDVVTPANLAQYQATWAEREKP
jgi:ribose transport system substrate-binding protein